MHVFMCKPIHIGRIFPKHCSISMKIVDFCSVHLFAWLFARSPVCSFVWSTVTQVTLEIWLFHFRHTHLFLHTCGLGVRACACPHSYVCVCLNSFFFFALAFWGGFHEICTHSHYIMSEFYRLLTKTAKVNASNPNHSHTHWLLSKSNQFWFWYTWCPNEWHVEMQMQNQTSSAEFLQCAKVK